MAESGKDGLSATDSSTDLEKDATIYHKDFTIPSSKRTAVKLQTSGFDCEFIERPKELETDCPICLMVLREPHQVSCCGHNYCRNCIQRVKSGGKDCPTCKKSDFDLFPDKGLHKSLYSFKVWCCNRTEGCNWAGELGMLASHLNDDSDEDHRLNGCEYVKISCFQCSELVTRKVLEKHEKSECVQRSYTCPLCLKYRSTFIEVTETHHQQCALQYVVCPNMCGIYLEKSLLESHLRTECPERVYEKVPCEFGFAGCMEVSAPENVQEHLDRNVNTHLSLLGSAYSHMRERLIEMQSHLDENDRYIEKLSAEKKAMQEKFQEEIKEIRELQYELDKLKMMQQQDRDSIEMLQSNSSILPVTITLEEYDKRKTKGDMGWTSTPFYTRQHGYLMCLWIDVGGNGAGKGIYISVFLSLLKGDYDSSLAWPFRGSIMVQLLNQMDKKSHHVEVIKYHESTPKASAGRIMDEGKKAKPWGKGKFIRHEDLRDGGFVVNDALKFHIMKA